MALPASGPPCLPWFASFLFCFLFFFLGGSGGGFDVLPRPPGVEGPWVRWLTAFPLSCLPAPSVGFWIVFVCLDCCPFRTTTAL